ncbi:membrane protein [Pragia fontium]|uniref:Membrane protein n=1 Tax=Pragia fontium TaxID=82985 RepID=A0ABQ5LCT4_9GAMM|nr:mucoidy inhibitor MuiA family protein [Pragia fontium]GKX61446.1 membrane protein [Pragia fontium]
MTAFYSRRFSISLLSASLALACPALAYADSLTEKVRLNDVTVFIRGAELFNSGKVSLPAGESEVVFTNIASGLNEQSLMIEADNGVVVQSSGVRRDYLSENLSPEVESLKKQIESEVRAQSKLNVQREVIQAQLAILESNRALGGEKEGASVEQVNQMLQLVNNKMREVLLTDIDLREQLAEIDKNIEKLNKQLAEAQQKSGQAVNQVVVKFYSPKAVTSDIKLSYVIRDAGWVPTYDVRVDNITQPVKLSYKANVFQNSGINWDKVNLTLSTGNPSEGAQAPRLMPWYIDLNKQPLLSVSKMKNDVMEVSAPAPSNALMGAELDGNFAEGAGLEQRKKVSKPLSDYVVTDVGGVNTRFSITLPYNIAADGKGHSVMIKQVDVQGDYRYVVVPKLEQDAFLQVQLKAWENLNLLPGKSNIFFEGSYVGQGYIDTRYIKDTLDLSLGRDKKILVNRENAKLTTAKAEFFGNSVNQQYSYTMDVRNTRKEPIKLVVLDQIPMSRNASVTVDSVQYDGASYNKDTGEVQWLLDLAPNELRKLSLSYTVKSPKDERVVGL